MTGDPSDRQIAAAGIGMALLIFGTMIGTVGIIHGDASIIMVGTAILLASWLAAWLARGTGS